VPKLPMYYGNQCEYNTIHIIKMWGHLKFFVLFCDGLVWLPIAFKEYDQTLVHSKKKYIPIFMPSNIVYMSRTLGKGYKITCYPIGNNLVTKIIKKRKSVNLVKTC
jgi:hypothetical protein